MVQKGKKTAAHSRYGKPPFLAQIPICDCDFPAEAAYLPNPKCGTWDYVSIEAYRAAGIQSQIPICAKS